jgi:hypothetical protein
VKGRRQSYSLLNTYCSFVIGDDHVSPIPALFITHMHLPVVACDSWQQDVRAHPMTSRRVKNTPTYDLTVPLIRGSRLVDIIIYCCQHHYGRNTTIDYCDAPISPTSVVRTKALDSGIRIPHLCKDI